jgi:hypothetical protein
VRNINNLINESAACLFLLLKFRVFEPLSNLKRKKDKLFLLFIQKGGRTRMDNKLLEMVLNDLGNLNERIGEKSANQLNTKLLERVIKRLGFFSGGCGECEKHLLALNDQIEKLKGKRDQFEKIDLKEHRLQVNAVTSHLQKEHKLISEGYYMTLYMSMGMSIGLIFGLLLFDNVGLGLPIGLSIGIAIGVSMDAAAKKKGLTI